MRSRKLRLSAAQKLLASIVALALVGMGSTYTLAAFRDSTSVPSNTLSTGSVSISDNDSGAAMLALAVAKPADTDVSCIRVAYAGSLPATVRLYGTTTGTGLDAYLMLTVTRGTLPSGTFDNCTGFTADLTNYIEAGNGVTYNGTLTGFADDYATGRIDPTAGSPEMWTTNETHDYRFQVTLGASDASQGKTATQTFVWEARTA
jgi:hypothetical protein